MHYLCSLLWHPLLSSGGLKLSLGTSNGSNDSATFTISLVAGRVPDTAAAAVDTAPVYCAHKARHHKLTNRQRYKSVQDLSPSETIHKPAWRAFARLRQILEFAAPAGKFEKNQQDSKCTKALRLRRQRVKEERYTGR